MLVQFLLRSLMFAENPREEIKKTLQNIEIRYLRFTNILEE